MSAITTDIPARLDGLPWSAWHWRVVIALGVTSRNLKDYLLLGRLMARTRRRWSARVMRTSNALDLEHGVFTKHSPREVALSLKRSAERSKRRKSAPFRSAMSMLVFHLNRGGSRLPAHQRKVLERAKDELRRLYARETPRRTRAQKAPPGKKADHRRRRVRARRDRARSRRQARRAAPPGRK